MLLNNSSIGKLDYGGQGGSTRYSKGEGTSMSYSDMRNKISKGTIKYRRSKGRFEKPIVTNRHELLLECRLVDCRPGRELYLEVLTAALGGS